MDPFVAPKRRRVRESRMEGKESVKCKGQREKCQDGVWIGMSLLYWVLVTNRIRQSKVRYIIIIIRYLIITSNYCLQTGPDIAKRPMRRVGKVPDQVRIGNDSYTIVSDHTDLDERIRYGESRTLYSVRSIELVTSATLYHRYRVLLEKQQGVRIVP